MKIKLSRIVVIVPSFMLKLKLLHVVILMGSLFAYLIEASCITSLTDDLIESRHSETTYLDGPYLDMKSKPVEFRLDLERRKQLMTQRSEEFQNLVQRTLLSARLTTQSGKSGVYLGGVKLHKTAAIRFVNYLSTQAGNGNVVLVDTKHFRVADGRPVLEESDKQRLMKGVIPDSVTVSGQKFALNEDTQVYALVETKEVPQRFGQLGLGSVIDFKPPWYVHYPPTWNSDSALDAMGFSYVYDKVRPIIKDFAEDQKRIHEIESRLESQKKTLDLVFSHSWQGDFLPLEDTRLMEILETLEEREHIYSVQIPRVDDPRLIYSMDLSHFVENYTRVRYFVGKLKLPNKYSYFKERNPVLHVISPEGQELSFLTSNLMTIEAFPLTF